MAKYFLLVAIVAFTCVLNSYAESDRDRIGFSKEVQRVEVLSIEYVSKFGEFVKSDPIVKNQYEFNLDGYLIHESSSNEYGGKSGEIKYFYNKDNRYEKIEHYGSDDKLSMVADYVYSPEGTSVTKRYYSRYRDDDIDKKDVWEYNIDGNLLAYISYNYDGDIESKKTYEYEGSLKKKLDVYDSYGALSERIFYEYKNDRLAKETFYNSNGQLASIREYTEEGRLKSIVDVDSRGSKNIRRYDYTKEGRLKSIVDLNSRGSETIVVNNTYDAQGNLIGRVENGARGEIIREWDKDGNLTKHSDRSKWPNGIHVTNTYASGKLVESTKKDNYDKLIDKRTYSYEYDDYGNTVKEMAIKYLDKFGDAYIEGKIETVYAIDYWGQ